MNTTNTLSLVKDELKKRLKKKKINDFEELDTKVAEELIHDEGLLLLDKFRDQTWTPVSLAQFFDANMIQYKNINIIKNDLDNLFDKDKVCYSPSYDFSRKVIISKKLSSGLDTVPKTFTIKYSIEEDDNDKKEIKYSLSCTDSTWGWNISKDQLKALAESSILYPEDILQNKKLTWKQRFKALFTGWIK